MGAKCFSAPLRPASCARIPSRLLEERSRVSVLASNKALRPSRWGDPVDRDRQMAGGVHVQRRLDPDLAEDGEIPPDIQTGVYEQHPVLACKKGILTWSRSGRKSKRWRSHARPPSDADWQHPSFLGHRELTRAETVCLRPWSYDIGFTVNLGCIRLAIGCRIVVPETLFPQAVSKVM